VNIRNKNGQIRCSLSLTLILIAVLTSAPKGWAQDNVEPQVLDNPEHLRPVTGGAVDRIYMAEGVASKLGDYNALIVEQPEIFFDPDSKYQGIEPDSLERLADDLAAAFTGELEGVYEVTDEAGPDVLRVRWALTNLRLKYKWSKNPLSYTPVGAGIHAVRKARRDDTTKKAALGGVMLELELLDSQTGERLAAAVASRHRQDEPTSWPGLEELMRTYGRLLKCRLDNARVPLEQWIDCVETLVEEPKNDFLTSP
jgi:hypothetical protein